MVLNSREVYASRAQRAHYGRVAPFHPATRYPEYDGPVADAGTNAAYALVRDVLRLTGLDRERFGTSEWNPLGALIRQGETVLLKPNMVKECHPRDPEGWIYVLTHGSIIRAIADYAWKAVGTPGRVIVADAPQTDSSFDEIVRRLGLREVQSFYASVGRNLELVDLRQEEWTSSGHVITRRRPLDGDPAGYIAFDLGRNSEFRTHAGAGRYYGADYDAKGLNEHHSNGRHEYLIAGTAIHADVVINIPKLKTHKKAGITAGLKNLVGINGDKNWLPHHTEGDASTGGDERPSRGTKHKAERQLAAAFRRLSLAFPSFGPWAYRCLRGAGERVFGDTEQVIRSGNWWGNDTVWRMCLDLNKILLYGNPDGTLRAPSREKRKRHFVLVDGIVAGQGSGPMNPDPIDAGVVIFGLSPAAVDASCAYLMGFDPEQIPVVRQAFLCTKYRLTEGDWRDVVLVSNHHPWNGPLPLVAREETLHFEPHFGWKGHIELCSNEEERDHGTTLSTLANSASAY
jgi:uncharacterized protein (DUF362 family)